MRLSFLSKQTDIINFTTVLLYGLFLHFFIFFLVKAGIVTTLPGAESLLRYDSNVYIDVALKGYSFNHPIYNNTGIYILFPWIWKYSHLGVRGICVLNYLFFAAGFTIMARLYKISITEKLLWLSVPTVYMMCIPYSEALFFLLIAMTLYGIKANNRIVLWIGLFLAALLKASTLFLLPSFLVVEILCNNTAQKWYKIVWKCFIDYWLPIILGLATFVIYQYQAVGIWFAYFHQQRRTEGHEFNLPILPFSSFEGERILWISAFAFFCCVIALLLLFYKSYQKFAKRINTSDKLLVLSAMYLAITLYKTIFNNPTWITGTTLLVGISRYVFTSPFFYVLLYHFTNDRPPYKPVHFLAAFVVCNIVWLLCGSYLHIQTFGYFNFISVLVFLYMFCADKTKTWALLAITAINFMIQIMMYQQFLNNLYLD